MSVSAARRRVLPARAMVVVAGLVLGACGGGTTVATGQNSTTELPTASTAGAAVTTPTSTATSASAAPPSTARATTTRGATGGPLAGRDAPAGSAGDQVSFVMGAGGTPPCENIDRSAPSTPTVIPDPDWVSTASMGSFTIRCFPGFTTARPVEAEIASPGGRITPRSIVTSNAGVPYMAWLPRPGDELGRYVVTARQGSSTATGEITVQPATEPSGIVLGSDARARTPRTEIEDGYTPSDRAGARLDVILAGFAPNQQVTMKFYRQTRVVNDTPMGDRTGTATVRVDGRGETVYILDTTGAERGTYLITTEPQLAQVPPPTFRLS